MREMQLMREVQAAEPNAGISRIKLKIAIARSLQLLGHLAAEEEEEAEEPLPLLMRAPKATTSGRKALLKI